MAWFYLILAGLFEVAWAVGMKASCGFTRPLPSLATALCLALSMGLLSLAMRQLPLGTAYAVWVGIGACGAVIAGAFLYAEPLNASRLFFLALLVVSLGGLKGL